MSGVQALTALAAVIAAAQKQGKQTPLQIAVAVDSAQMLMCPETATDLHRLRKRVAELEADAVADAVVLPWVRRLDKSARHELVAYLAAALLGYWHEDPDAEVLARVEAVLVEQRKEATAGGAP